MLQNILLSIRLSSRHYLASHHRNRVPNREPSCFVWRPPEAEDLAQWTPDSSYRTGYIQLEYGNMADIPERRDTDVNQGL